MAARGGWPDTALGDIRPYTITGGRTRTTHELYLTTCLLTRPTTGQFPAGAESEALLLHCSATPCSVAELAGRLHQPVQVIKILVGDLLDAGALALSNPARPTAAGPDTYLLEAVLHGLRNRL
ncbi:DUF742 domain-containing protein [Streptomyces sp. NPDC051555]|uniref:DUF742 domain-containing protein n=1 Tax=Streptomyces sp. NPDC051555 TaxID=3365657 RepID=UPI0037944392